MTAGMQVSSGRPAGPYDGSLFDGSNLLPDATLYQMHARAHRIPIDSLTFETNVQTYSSPDELPGPPETGVNIHGVFLQVMPSWSIS